MSVCRRLIIACACSSLLTIGLTGCKSTGNTGPIYKLHVSAEQPPAAPVAVSITDARPSDERKYRPGAIQPAEYRNGIETLVLENFEPFVTDLLNQTLTQRLAALPKPPVWADVEVTRFRAVIDRREILAAEYEQELLDEQVGSAVDIGVGIGAGAGPGGIAGGLMAAAAASNSLRKLEADRSAWDHALSGVTCEIELRVQLHWDGDRHKTLNLTARSHSMPPDDGRLVDLRSDMKWNIGPTVEKAIDQIGIDLQLKASTIADQLGPTLEHLPPTRGPKAQDSSGPQFESLP